VTVDEIKRFLYTQIPPEARRASLIFVMQAIAHEELRRIGAPEAENVRSAMDRLRRAAEDAGAKPMGVAAMQSYAPMVLDHILKML
jgi:hypothetical protein